jgi:AcrR family transcriptional regulator
MPRSGRYPGLVPANQTARLRKPRDRYHHGDLRSALVATALRIVAEQGVGALTLRDLARRLGVSHAAPAHHFPDRASLLVALAGEGFLRLGEALARGTRAPARARGARLLAAGRAYVAFALDHPGFFRVMFGPHVAELPRATAEVARAADGGYRVLEHAVEELVGPGDPRVAPLTFASWSLLHGACTLFLDGLLPRQLPELAARSAFEAHVERALAALADRLAPER